jgi:hypothetical protein
MPKALGFTLVALSAVAFGPTTALAGQITNADLEGKRICWNNGAIATYGKGGSFDCNK